MAMSSRKLGNEYSEEFQRELSWIWKMLENRNVTEISAKEVIIFYSIFIRDIIKFVAL